MSEPPQQEAMEAAVAYLLAESFSEIRFELAPLRDDVPLKRRIPNAWVLADLCHNLPPWLDPSRRSRIQEGVEYVWATSSALRRRWIRSCWDRIGYDYSWLPEQPGGGEEVSRTWTWQDPTDLDEGDHRERHNRR